MRRKVHRINKAGSISSLKLVEEELSEPASDEVRVKVDCVGLNFADVFALVGLYSATPKGSFIPGLEFSGFIDAVGKSIREFNVGDRVMGVTRFGGYADYLNTKIQYLQKIPSAWSMEEGSGFIVQALTAYYALLPLGRLKQDETVLIHSAAGGVGIFANRIAKKHGAYTIGTVSSADKIDTLINEGYDGWIVRKSNFKNQLTEALGERKLDIVLECIGGKVFSDSLSSLGLSGRMIVYGAANFAPSGASPNYLKLAYQYLTRPKVDPLSMIALNQSVSAFNLIWLWDRVDELSGMIKDLLNYNLSPQIVDRTYPFENAKEALKYFKSGQSRGKIILKVSH